MKYPHWMVAALFLPVFLWGFAIAAAQQAEDNPVLQLVPSGAAEPLVRPGPTPDLELLFTSEVKGYYQPCG